MKQKIKKNKRINFPLNEPINFFIYFLNLNIIQRLANLTMDKLFTVH